MNQTEMIHRRFFTAAIACGLTAGAAWGVWLLLRISETGSFTGVSIHPVNAHGHAQVYGWVGLFIMGFAYTAMPQLWMAALAWPRAAGASFALMIAGLALGVAGGATAPGLAPGVVATLGCALEVAAVALFVMVMVKTFQRSLQPMAPWIAFVFAGLAFFALSVVFNAWHTWMTATAADRESLVAQIGTFQAPLRNMQIHGMALFMILGVSQRLLPVVMGAPPTPARRGWIALWLLLGAVAVETLAFLAFRLTGAHALAGLAYLSWLALPVCVWLVAGPWRLWSAPARASRSSKFVRTAYLWLAITMAMMLLMPVHRLVSGEAFSHAYYGAMRHALTVGFVSQMIVAMASWFVPKLRGIDETSLPRLTGVFVLLNAGCALRVLTQTLTDFHAGAFAIIALSGGLELLALALWGGGLARLMWRPAPGGRPPAETRISPPAGVRAAVGAGRG